MTPSLPPLEVSGFSHLRIHHKADIGLTPDRAIHISCHAKLGENWEMNMPGAVDVSVTDDTLTVFLEDGRSISVPATWYPRLAHGTQEERKNWRLISAGHGIHWEALDEDISVAGLLAGKASGESHESLNAWLLQRQPLRDDS